MARKPPSAGALRPDGGRTEVFGQAVPDLLDLSSRAAKRGITLLDDARGGGFEQIRGVLESAHDRLSGLGGARVRLMSDLLGRGRLIGRAETGQHRGGGAGDSPHDGLGVVGSQAERPSILAQQENDVVAGEGCFTKRVGQQIPST